ncbi:hypothetical protein FIBSPDRAFT_176255 [Athelia psychrophila]|uniref:Uncharacterized protein n=1 Tax=Athelia psychrophila TaxID=1759441 RepID=A0A166AM46_9AGAM|nr:hypothetical protein FIBSPDRAFT_176255 [Fibularhizoctonia sp. CBS 109695]
MCTWFRTYKCLSVSVSAPLTTGHRAARAGRPADACMYVPSALPTLPSNHHYIISSTLVSGSYPIFIAYYRCADQLYIGLVRQRRPSRPSKGSSSTGGRRWRGIASSVIVSDAAQVMCAPFIFDQWTSPTAQVERHSATALHDLAVRAVSQPAMHNAQGRRSGCYSMDPPRPEFIHPVQLIGGAVDARYLIRGQIICEI